jgi:hypothetical protein
MKCVSAYAQQVERRTLDDTVLRAMTFLAGVTRSARARAALRRRGYGPAHHDEGWARIALVCIAPFPVSSRRGPQPDALAAAQAIEERDGDVFRIVRAALAYRHPPQAAFLLRDIGPAKGPAAVRNIRLLVERLEALAPGAGEEDHAALATLASRGFGPAEIAELRALGDAAASAEPVTEDGAEERAEATRHAALLELRAWYVEWAELTRASIKDRRLLQRLGLVGRLRRDGTGA